jgi:hypothetical protein
MVPSHMGIYVLANAIMYLIYRAKHPFFERYKVLDVLILRHSKKPWPWEQHPAKFR